MDYLGISRGDPYMCMHLESVVRVRRDALRLRLGHQLRRQRDRGERVPEKTKKRADD